LKDVGGLGELPGTPRAATQLVQDVPALEPGIRPLAALSRPAGVAVDRTGNLVIIDTNNRRVRAVTR
jgi:hypothetical protein